MREFRRHLIDAIQLNVYRKELYAELTNDESLHVSIQIVVWEKLALPVAWYFDQIGDRFQRQGVPFIKAEMPDFSTVPEFAEEYPAGIDFTEPYKGIPLKSLKYAIKRANKQRNFQKVFDLCEFALMDLGMQEHLHCCLRYVLESIRKCAYEIHSHIALSRELKIEPPIRYTQQLIQAHLWIIEMARDLDIKAADIQNQGVPILFQDFPSIEIGDIGNSSLRLDLRA